MDCVCLGDSDNESWWSISGSVIDTLTWVLYWLLRITLWTGIMSPNSQMRMMKLIGGKWFAPTYRVGKWQSQNLDSGKLSTVSTCLLLYYNCFVKWGHERMQLTSMKIKRLKYFFLKFCCYIIIFIACFLFLMALGLRCFLCMGFLELQWVRLLLFLGVLGFLPAVASFSLVYQRLQ